MSSASSIPTMQIVIAGRSVAGHLLSRGIAGIEAFDRDDHSIGIFATADEAARALGWQP
jgi:hypothetical protein